jgi:hypothetical protein
MCRDRRRVRQSIAAIFRNCHPERRNAIRFMNRVPESKDPYVCRVPRLSSLPTSPLVWVRHSPRTLCPVS